MSMFSIVFLCDLFISRNCKFSLFFSSPKSPPKVVYSNDKFIRRFNCEQFLENDSSEGILHACLFFFFDFMQKFFF